MKRKIVYPSKASSTWNTARYFEYCLGDAGGYLEMEAFKDGTATLRVVLGDLSLGDAYVVNMITTIPDLTHFQKAICSWKRTERKKTK